MLHYEENINNNENYASYFSQVKEMNIDDQISLYILLPTEMIQQQTLNFMIESKDSSPLEMTIIKEIEHKLSEIFINIPITLTSKQGLEDAIEEHKEGKLPSPELAIKFLEWEKVALQSAMLLDTSHNQKLDISFDPAQELNSQLERNVISRQEAGEKYSKSNKRNYSNAAPLPRSQGDSPPLDKGEEVHKLLKLSPAEFEGIFPETREF